MEDTSKKQELLSKDRSKALERLERENEALKRQLSLL